MMVNDMLTNGEEIRLRMLNDKIEARRAEWRNSRKRQDIMIGWGLYLTFLVLIAFGLLHN